jgi:hypothetical protein
MLVATLELRQVEAEQIQGMNIFRDLPVDEGTGLGRHAR